MYHDEDEDTAIEWIESPAFQKDYTLASDLLTRRDSKTLR
ncbi:hypothetical protein ALQ30_200043 [Pseudomonas syringae pv. persicae]|nr:hypothetical protein ALQ30_200043 [Pseudomonas syringae pv. persicae]